ncbi:type II secretion system secretin GspD [Desulfobacterales bacterium HSG16]|nr:type II secretion system secretin GspD [Desulfobacterales bacterium HSG16]
MKSQSRHPYKIAALFGLVFFLLTALLIPAYCADKKLEPLDSNHKGDRAVSLDFNDVDIGLLIKFISELTGKNFIVDKRVKGKVTVISSSRISIAEAYKVFESVLEVHGFTAVEAGEVTKIISSPDARSKNIETLLKNEARSPEDKVVTQIIPLRYADPNDIKRLFSPLISKGSVILAYQPTNTLMVTDIYSNIKRLMKILDQIDVTGVGQEISVISLEFADSQKLVKILTTVFKQARKGKKGVTSGDNIRFVADERTNSLILLASEDNTVRIRKLIDRLDREVPRGKEKIHVYYLENATAEDLAKVLQSLSGKQNRSTKKGKKEAPIVSEAVKITADKATNSLIIMAEKDDYLVLEEIIRKLDIPRSMVYIECLIMEVNVDKGFNMGTEWVVMGEASHDGTSGGFGGGFGGGENAYSNIAGMAGSAIGTFPAGFSLGVFSEPLKIGDVIFPNLAAIINAYKKDKDVHILSTPQILTTDNEEATIVVGKNVPYQTKESKTSVDAYSSYEYKDVGITLTITPQISKDGLVRLKILQDINKLDEGSSVSESSRPTTLKRKIETTVIVHDKNTIVIGGLIDDSLSESNYQIPCLGEIPLAGWMFRSLKKTRERGNLYVFLTPHVIENKEDAKAFYEQKKGHIDRIDEETGIKMYTPVVDDDEDEEKIEIPNESN